MDEEEAYPLRHSVRFGAAEVYVDDYDRYQDGNHVQYEGKEEISELFCLFFFQIRDFLQDKLGHERNCG